MAVISRESRLNFEVGTEYEAPKPVKLFGEQGLKLPDLHTELKISAVMAGLRVVVCEWKQTPVAASAVAPTRWLFRWLLLGRCLSGSLQLVPAAPTAVAATTIELA